VKAVGDPDGRGCPLVRAPGVSSRPITRDHFHPRMFPAPRRQGLRGTIREEGGRLAALEIHQDGTITLAFPQGAIVHAEASGTRARWDRQPAEQAQQGATAAGQAQATAEPDARGPTQGYGAGRQPLQEALCPPGPRGHHAGPPRRQAAAWTASMGTEKPPDTPRQDDVVVGPRQVGHGPPIATMEAPRGTLAHGTGPLCLRGLHAQGHLRGGGVDLPRLQVKQGCLRAQGSQAVHRPLF
jgi:hypothetical protein